MYAFRIHCHQHYLVGIKAQEINHPNTSPLATSLDCPPQFPAATGMRDYVALIRVFSQIKLKRREFVIVQILITNRGKWVQFDECEHGLLIRLRRTMDKWEYFQLSCLFPAERLCA